MDVLALRSPGLPNSEIKHIAAELGITVTVVTSLEEGEQRGLPLDTVIVDGMGETAEVLNALNARLNRITKVIWVGFEAPGTPLPGLVVVSPINMEGDLSEALVGTGAPPVDATMVPISLVPTEPLEPVAVTWDLEVQQPRAPQDKRPPKIAPIDVHLVDPEPRDEVHVEVAVGRRSGPSAWRDWLTPVLGVGIAGSVVVWLVAFSLSSGTDVALPSPATQLPTYAPSKRSLPTSAPVSDEGTVAPTIVDEVPSTVPVRPMKVLEKSQPSPAKKRAAGTLARFNAKRLRDCLARLGKKGKASFKRRGRLTISMRLGVMGDGKIAAATTTGVRIGKKRYKSRRFNACAEGKVVGQQMGIRPESEPTFVRRTFTLRP